jgi:hypothetical protein
MGECSGMAEQRAFTRPLLDARVDAVLSDVEPAASVGAMVDPDEEKSEVEAERGSRTDRGGNEGRDQTASIHAGRA